MSYARWGWGGGVKKFFNKQGVGHIFINKKGEMVMQIKFPRGGGLPDFPKTT